MATITKQLRERHARIRNNIWLSELADDRTPLPVVLLHTSRLGCDCWAEPIIFALAKQKTFAHYQAACAQCERWVIVPTIALLYRLRAALHYDKRKAVNAGRGRVLKVDLPELQLLAGDRLEPHEKMPDVGVIDDCKTAPIELLFWRRSCETIARHRNPLFDEDLGITPENIFVPDWLHSLSLGVYKRIINVAWHRFFEMNMFDVDELQRSVRHVFVESCVLRLREKLFAWYRTEAIAGRNHTRVQNLTAGMVGLSQDHQLGSHGSETNGLFFLRIHCWLSSVEELWIPIGNST